MEADLISASERLAAAERLAAENNARLSERLAAAESPVGDMHRQLAGTGRFALAALEERVDALAELEERVAAATDAAAAAAQNNARRSERLAAAESPVLAGTGFALQREMAQRSAMALLEERVAALERDAHSDVGYAFPTLPLGS